MPVLCAISYYSSMITYTDTKYICSACIVHVRHIFVLDTHASFTSRDGISLDSKYRLPEMTHFQLLMLPNGDSPWTSG